MFIQVRVGFICRQVFDIPEIPGGLTTDITSHISGLFSMLPINLDDSRGDNVSTGAAGGCHARRITTPTITHTDSLIWQVINRMSNVWQIGQLKIRFKKNLKT